MTDFDPSNPDPYKRMNWALRNYWWAIIPLVALLFMIEVAADSLGYDGKTIVQVGILLFGLAALWYDRRTKRKKAEAEAEKEQ